MRSVDTSERRHKERQRIFRFAHQGGPAFAIMVSWLACFARIDSDWIMADSPAQKARLDALGPGFVGRGQALADAGAVSRLSQGPVGDSWILTAEVADANQASFRVYVRVDKLQVEGDCSCPRKSQCEHVAAAVLAARAGQPRERAMDRADVRGARLQSSTRQRMVYLLRLSDDGHELSVCPSRQILDSKGAASATPYSLTRLADSRQPDYVGDDDLRILHELADRMAGALDLVWAPLGPRSHALLEAIVATGRGLWRDVSGATLKLGPALEMGLNWQVLRSGYQELTLEGEEQDAMRQLPLLPPWRVNPETGLCRPLATGHDSELVAELLEAGPVAPEASHALIDRLARVAPEFPAPNLMRCKTLSQQTPEFELNLLMIELGSAQRFTREPAARLSFRYGSVELDWDDEYSSALIEPGHAVRVLRDRAAEEQAVSTLEIAGLVPLQDLPGRDYRPGEGGLWVARQARRPGDLDRSPGASPRL